MTSVMRHKMRMEAFTSTYLNVASISNVMSSKRYKKLIENLHLNNNDTTIPKGQNGYNKLHKVSPLIEMDESMIPFKGRSSI